VCDPEYISLGVIQGLSEYSDRDEEHEVRNEKAKVADLESPASSVWRRLQTSAKTLSVVGLESVSTVCPTTALWPVNRLAIATLVHGTADGRGFSALQSQQTIVNSLKFFLPPLLHEIRGCGGQACGSWANVPP
jgi:hypothetical protein